VTSAAISILLLAALAALLVGAIHAGRRLVFLLNAKRVHGRVIREWRYRMYGRAKRYYRVEFMLSTGQRAELRSSVASSSNRPKVGEVVPVLVLEQSGRSPKAKIDTWPELWFTPAVLLSIGVVGAISAAWAGASSLFFR
jgi:hypothetical protein